MPIDRYKIRILPATDAMLSMMRNANKVYEGRKLDLVQALIYSQIPTYAWNADIHKVAEQHVKEFLSKYQKHIQTILDKKHLGCFFHGPTGSGKTCAITYLAKYVLTQDRSVWYYDCASLSRDVFYVPRDEDDINRLETVAERAEFLIFDNFVENLTPKGASIVMGKVAQILRQRQGRTTTSIITQDVSRLSDEIRSIIDELMVEIRFGDNKMRKGNAESEFEEL